LGAVLSEVRARVQRDHIVIVAAGVAFNFFASIFPTLFALVSIYGLLADPQQAESQVAMLSGLLPPAALKLVSEQLQSIVATSPTTLGWGTAISVALALWSAAAGSGAMIEGLNVAYEVQERRGFLKLRAVALATSLGFVLFLILAVVLIAAVPGALALLPMNPGGRLLTQVVQWALLIGLILLALGLLYRHAPSPPGGARGFLTPGAITAALLWLAASALFSWYASSFGDFNRTHGALGAVVALLLWLQLSCLVVLLGAELDAASRPRPAERPV
jgi:membrane protein